MPFFRDKSRSQKRADNNLGIINLTPNGAHGAGGSHNDRELDSRKYRDGRLHVFDLYYENKQYDQLSPWDQKCEEYVEVRKRQPRIKLGYARTLASRVAAKLIGAQVWPTFKIEASPDDQELVKAIIKTSQLNARLLEPMKRMLNTGSVFVRFWIEAGAYKVDYFDAKYCYPTWQDNGELEVMRVQYVYVDHADLDARGRPKQKWWRMDFTMNAEILFDNPEFDPEAKEPPVFQVVEKVDHNLGFVQGEWFKTCDLKDSDDGYGLVADITDFIDELCYSMSQSSQAVGYNQDPQVYFQGMTKEETERMIRSALKSWNLGREGKAGILQTDMAGVIAAGDLRDKVRLSMQDITRIVMIDPEKAVAQAQSAKAMEVLYAPLVELVDEIRPVIEPRLISLVLKMTVATLILAQRGEQVPIALPAGYAPTSLEIDLKWKPMFQQTMEDLQKKVGVATAAKNGGLIAPKTAMLFTAEDFGVEDVDAELAAVDEAAKAAAALNPYGGF